MEQQVQENEREESFSNKSVNVVLVRPFARRFDITRWGPSTKQGRGSVKIPDGDSYVTTTIGTRTGGIEVMLVRVNRIDSAMHARSPVASR